jgi:hypothetical protein
MNLFLELFLYLALYAKKYIVNKGFMKKNVFLYKYRILL